MDFQKQLKSLSLSVTPVRLAVLESLVQQPHSEASKVFDSVKNKIQSVSIQAVYNNLNILVSHGLVREIRPKGMLSLYEIRTEKNDGHHHLICRKCGLTEDATNLSSIPTLKVDDLKDFAIDEAEIIFWGLCPKCQKK